MFLYNFSQLLLILTFSRLFCDVNSNLSFEEVLSLIFEQQKLKHYAVCLQKHTMLNQIKIIEFSRS